MERPQIMLVSKSEELRYALSRLLLRFNYELLYAPTAQLAMQLVHKQPKTALAIFHGELIDISVIDAIKALRKFRKGFPAIVIIPPEQAEKFGILKESGSTGIVTLPLNLGRLLLKINRYAQESEQSQTVPAVTASHLALAAETFFTIRDISETGCCLRANFPIPLNNILVLESQELSYRLGMGENNHFPVRVVHCSPGDTSKSFDIGVQFIGLTDQTKARLRSACLSVKGFKYTNSGSNK